MIYQVTYANANLAGHSPAILRWRKTVQSLKHPTGVFVAYANAKPFYRLKAPPLGGQNNGRQLCWLLFADTRVSRSDILYFQIPIELFMQLPHFVGGFYGMLVHKPVPELTFVNSG